MNMQIVKFKNGKYGIRKKCFWGDYKYLCLYLNLYRGNSSNEWVNIKNKYNFTIAMEYDFVKETLDNYSDSVVLDYGEPV